MNTRPGLHPACAAFPAMPDNDLQELAGDIKQHGLLEEITMTADGLLLDGRCRWDACAIAGVEPRTIQYHGDDPVGFVLSKNRHRRHMNKSQMALIVAGLVTLAPGSNQYQDKTKVVLKKKNLSAEDLSKQSDVPLAYTNYGRTLLKQGAPHIVDMVRRGEVNVRVAAEAVRLVDPAEQVGWTKADVEREGREVIQSYPSNQAKTHTNKPKRKPAKPSPRRPQAEPLPTYWPTMTFEEAGFPPRDTWDEPDSERPGLTKFQGHVAKHGHVHAWPLHVRQAQDNKIAARGLSAKLRELLKPLTQCAEFMASDPPPLDLAMLATTLDEMEPDDAARTRRRLTALFTELPDLTGIDSLCGYLQRLRDLIATQPAAEPKEETCA